MESSENAENSIFKSSQMFVFRKDYWMRNINILIGTRYLNMNEVKMAILMAQF